MRSHQPLSTIRVAFQESLRTQFAKAMNVSRNEDGNELRVHLAANVSGKWDSRDFLDAALLPLDFYMFDTALDGSDYGQWLHPKYLCYISYIEGDVLLYGFYEVERYNQFVKALLPDHTHHTTVVDADRLTRIEAITDQYFAI